jgi:hypothetical protein
MGSKSKKNKKSDAAFTMSTGQILPYVNSAMELAAEQLGTGTSLRKVNNNKEPFKNS